MFTSEIDLRSWELTVTVLMQCVSDIFPTLGLESLTNREIQQVDSEGA